MSSSLGVAQLDALVSLIVTSVNDFKAEYHSANIPVPVLREPASEGHDEMRKRESEKLAKAVKIIEAACAQLSAIVVRPELTLVNASSKHAICACLQVTSSHDIAKRLLSSPKGQHVAALSEASGIESDSLSRILRLLATNHIFQEVAPDVFANNMVSVKLATNAHAKECVETRTRESLRVSSYINEFLSYSRPSSSMPVSPFQIAYGTPLMDYHNTPEGKQTVAKFMAGVTGWGEIAMSSDLSLSGFPWIKFFSRLKTEKLRICDIGAGEGHILLNLAFSYPTYSFYSIIQDRPAILELSKKLWDRRYPEALQDGLVEFAPIDFFNESPVENCDIYYIRHCIHNWPDEKCVEILKNIAKSMRSKKDSILLIHEIVLRPAISQEISENDVTADPASPPAPLLNNFGVASSLEYAADISMLGLLNSKERTLDEYISLGTKAGLAYECIWSMEGSGIVQFKLEK